MKFKKIVKETKKPMKKAQKKEQWWFDIPGAKHIYHGDWSDPEIQYKGFSINYWDVIEGMSNSYRDEHPEDKDEKGFDAWLEEQGGPGGYLQGELDNLVYAALGDDGLEDEEWLGIPDAYKVKEVYGQGDGDFVLYKDCLVNVSDFDYYDKDYDDYFTYDHDPQGFEAYYIDKSNRGELIDQLNSAVRGLVPNAQLLEEGFKDAIKSGWKKVKDGAKKFSKAIGDAFKGPFRKGDHIVMKGENGEEFKGTIKGFDLGDKTYEVLLGNPVNEGLQEDVLDMADREDELVWMIQEKFWDLAEEADPDSLRQLIENCVELERVKPGRLQEIINEEF